MVLRTGWSLDKFGFANVCGNRQEAVEWGEYPELCIRAVRHYDADQDCEVYKE